MRQAGAIRRSSYATLAVGATTLALIALLGVSVLVARQGQRGDGRQEVAGLASADRSGTLDGGGSKAGAAGASSAGNGSGAPDTGLRGGAGSGTGAGAAGAGGGDSAGPASASSGSGTGAVTGSDVGASGGTGSDAGASGSGSGSGTGSAGSGSGSVAASPDGSPTTMTVRPAKAGDWTLRVESHAEGALLGDDSGESRLSVGEAAADGTQRFDARDGPALGVFGAYTARVVSQGRYLTELQLRGEPGRRFVAAVPVLDVPSTWRAGDRWTWRLTAADGGTSLEAASSVVGRETITLADGETEVETVRVDSTFVLGGDRSITVTRKLWFSPSLGVPVRTEERSTGTDQDGRSVARDATIQLAATEPGSTSVFPRP